MTMMRAGEQWEEEEEEEEGGGGGQERDVLKMRQNMMF